MTKILTDISTYDVAEHLPMPTLEFIRDETGFDLFKETGDYEKAKTHLKVYTKTAWKVLASSKTIDTKNKIEFLIATKEDWRREFLDLVASFVTSVYQLGGMDFLSATQNPDLTRELPIIVQAQIKGGLLGLERIALTYDYRVGY